MAVDCWSPHPLPSPLSSNHIPLIPLQMGDVTNPSHFYLWRSHDVMCSNSISENENDKLLVYHHIRIIIINKNNFFLSTHSKFKLKLLLNIFWVNYLMLLPLPAGLCKYKNLGRKEFDVWNLWSILSGGWSDFISHFHFEWGEIHDFNGVDVAVPIEVTTLFGLRWVWLNFLPTWKT